jgi:hypothetical protein
MDKSDFVIVPNRWQTFSVYKIEEPCAFLASSITITEDFKDWNGVNIIQNKMKQLFLENEKDPLDLGFLEK